MYSNDFVNGKHEMSEFNIDTKLKLKRVFVSVCMHTLYRVQSSILAGNRLFHFPTISFIYIQSTIIAHRDLHFQSQNIQILHMVFTLPFQTAAPHKTKNSLQLPKQMWHSHRSIREHLHIHIPMTGQPHYTLQPKAPQ